MVLSLVESRVAKLAELWVELTAVVLVDGRVVLSAGNVVVSWVVLLVG